MTSKRNQLFIIIFILALVGIFQISTIRKGIDWNGDFSLYIQHAKNIALGNDYEKTGYIYNPANPMVGPSIYPPIFPLLLSPVYSWFGLNFTAMKIEIITMFLLSLFLFYKLIKNNMPFLLVVIVLLIVGFNPYFWRSKDFILSDIPFLMFSNLSLLLILKKNQFTRTNKSILLYSILVGLVIYLSYGTRSIGIVTIVSMVLFDIYKKRNVSKFTILVTIAFIFFVFLQKVFIHSESNYSDIFSMFTIFTVPNNIILYTKSFARIWGNGYNDIIASIIFLVLSFFFVIGYITKFKKTFSILEVFLPAYIAIVLIFPGFQGVRYLIPVIPLIIFYAFYGMLQLNFIQDNIRKKIVIHVFSISILFTYVSKYTTENYETINEKTDDNEAINLFSFISNNTNKEDVFIFIKPRILSLFTERHSAIYNNLNGDIELMDFFKHINAKYIIVINKGSKMHYRFENYLGLDIPSLFVEKNTKRFEEIFSNNDYKIFEINKGSFK